MTDKIFTLNKDRNIIHGLTLSANDDLSTAVVNFDNTLPLAAKETSLDGQVSDVSQINEMIKSLKGETVMSDEVDSITYSTDGSSLFIYTDNMNATGDRKIVKYALEVPFLPSTGEYVQESVDLDTLSTGYYECIEFNDTGDTLYCGQASTDTIKQFSLSTPWDLSTLSYVGDINSISSVGNAIRSLRFANAGSKLYVHQYGGNTVYQFSLSTPYDISTATNDSKSFNFGSIFTYNLFGMDFNDDGTRMIAFEVDGATYDFGLLHLVELSTPWDISTASSISTKNIENLSWRYLGYSPAPIIDARITNNGKNIAFCNGSAFYNIIIEQGSLNSAFTEQVYETSYQSFAFSASGNKVYVIGEDTKRIYEYDVSPAYEISNAVMNQSFKYDSSYNLGDFVFDSTGTVMFALDVSDTSIRRFTLSTPWDISTLTYTNKYSVATQISSAGSIAVNNVGSRVYVTNINNNVLYEYKMDPNWEFSGISYTGNTYPLSNESPMVRGVDFSEDGLNMYSLGNSAKTLFQYSSSVNATGGYSTDVSAFNLASLPTTAFLTGDLPIFETSFGDTGRSLINDVELDFTSATSTEMTSPFPNGRIPAVGDTFVFYTVNAQVSGEDTEITNVVDEGGGTYTVTYNAISASPDKQYGLPVMKARRVAHSATDYLLSNGTDITMIFDPVAAQGRELAFRHVSKLPDDLIKLTRYDLMRLQS